MKHLDFIDKTNLNYKAEPERAKLVCYYDYKENKTTLFSMSDISKLLQNFGYSKPNISRLKEKLIKGKDKAFIVSNSDKNKIEFYGTKEDYENVKKYGREFFIKMVDFIFYDKDINGIKFSDLKEETKEEVYNTFCDIDALIMTFSSDYKENIGEKYEVVKDFTSKTYYNALDKIREAIGDEKYDKVKEIKDNTKEKIKDGTDNAKEYIKKKYENWRDR